jgi:lipooligosaccharide transport system permease protein
LPLGFIVGLTFGEFGLVMNSLAPDTIFTYFSLWCDADAVAFRRFLSGRPDARSAKGVAKTPPLSHAIDIARPLLSGRIPDGIPVHVAVLLAYAFAAYYVALVLTRRRLLK